MDDPLLWSLILQISLIALNAIFACAEIAAISINDNKLAKLASAGDKKAIRLSKLLKQPAKFLATIQVAITLSGFLGSAFAADNFSEPLVKWLTEDLKFTALSASTLDAICVVLITLVLSYFTLVFGELVPKRLGMRNPEKLALRMSGLIKFISTLFAPIVWLLTASTNIILRILHIDPNEEDDKATEEDIRMMVDAGSEKGTIDEDEKEMIQNVFEFDDITAREIMTHRTDVSILWLDESDEEWNTTINESRHTIYPVCSETTDDVIGLLNTKDYFRLADKSRKNVIDNVLLPVWFVPEAVKADVLFKNMKKERKRFAVLLDEYGGVSGIVTMFDLLEQIVGDLDDDAPAAKAEPREIERIDSKTLMIRGEAPLDKVSKALGITLPEECEEYDTFGGMIFGSLGTIPEDGERFETELYGMQIKVKEIRDHRIERATVCLIQPHAEEKSEETE